MKTKNLELILKDNDTGEILHTINTNCAFVCASVKPQQKGTFDCDAFVFYKPNVNGAKVVSTLNNAIDYADQFKDELLAEKLNEARKTYYKNKKGGTE